MRQTAFTFILSLFAQATLASPLAKRDCARPVASNSTKRGLAYNDANFANYFDTEKINWAYNWGQTSDGLQDEYEYVPMLWGSKTASTWDKNAQAAIAAGSKHLLGLNEPDDAGQSNMDAGTAASLWHQYMEPYKCSALLGAPAVTNGGPPMGLTWLKGFLGACQGCTIDFVPIHWYDSATNTAYFKSYIQEAYTAGGQRPLWITEFGFVNSSEDQINSFLGEILPWLDSLDYVQRYSYFMADSSQGLLPLLSSDGKSLSSIGEVYNSV